MLQIDNLKVKYGDFTALDIRRKITIKPKERIGIIGSNGAGKTTFLKAILGMAPVEGRIVSQLSNEDIAVHMQENNYTDLLKIKIIIETICNTKIKNDKRLQNLIEFFDFAPSLNKKYKNLSGGQKQRLTLILVMYQETELVFFDEVTSGLDFETRMRLTEKIKEWYKDKETALCIISHYYEELENLVDKVMYLDQGNLIDFEDKSQFFEKYCGKSILCIKYTAEHDELTANYKKLVAPENMIVISCTDKEEESQLINILVKSNADFQRFTENIEIATLNAKAQYYAGGER